MVVILIIFILLGGYIFTQSDAYLKMKAKRLTQQGEYALAIDALDEMIERSGVDGERIMMRSEALLAQGQARMDHGDYREAVPLFRRVIENNLEFEGSGGNKEFIVKALYDTSICFLMLAQDRGEYIEPFCDELVSADDAVDELLVVLEEIDVDWKSEMAADAHILASNIAAERASYFWHIKNKSQAKAYLLEAEKEFGIGISEVKEKSEYTKLGLELSKLHARIAD